MTYINEEIIKGENATITATVTKNPPSDWSDKNAVLKIVSSYSSDPVIEKAGTIDASSDKITFELTPEQTDSLLIRTYIFDITIYTTDRSYVKFPIRGTITVLNVSDSNPID